MAKIEAIRVGQVWTGKSGMGPTVTIRTIDTVTACVHYEYTSGDSMNGRFPAGDSDLSTFVRTYRLVSDKES